MPKGPAARILDKVIHPLPGMLFVGPGSMNVIIGKKPAWRGIPAAAAAAMQAARAAADIAVTAAETATKAAAPTPGGPAALAAEMLVKTTAAAAFSSACAAFAGMSDIHTCLTPVPPHGAGVVIDGSQTVLINGMPACRVGDTVLEILGPPNKIIMGEFTVIIGP